MLRPDKTTSFDWLSPLSLGHQCPKLNWDTGHTGTKYAGRYDPIFRLLLPRQAVDYVGRPVNDGRHSPQAEKNWSDRPCSWQARNNTERCVSTCPTFMGQGNKPPVGLRHLSVGHCHRVAKNSTTTLLTVPQNPKDFEQAKARLLLFFKAPLRSSKPTAKVSLA